MIRRNGANCFTIAESAGVTCFCFAEPVLRRCEGFKQFAYFGGLFCTVDSSALFVSGIRASGLPGWPPAPGRIAERGLGKRSTRSGLALLPIHRPVIAGHTSPGSLNYATPPKLLTLPCFPSAPVASTGSVQLLDEGVGEPFNRGPWVGAPALGVGRH